MKKRVVSIVLGFSLVMSGLAGCSGDKYGDGANTTTDSAKEESTGTAAGSTDETGETVDDDFEMSEYDQVSAEVYEKVLGEFAEYYAAAKANATTVSERYALMAVAEAKLLETAVVIPTVAAGGMYAMSRVAPYTVDYVMWGSDYERYHQAVVATEFITTEDRSVMKAKWSELKGTGEYEAWAKSYLIEHGYTLKDSYTLNYSSDPTTWDPFATYLASDSSAIVNTYDGLLEYDNEGVLQPALAESYEVSEDGLTYTFHLREGVKWVDSQGREVATLTADDFVAGFQHMMDAEAGMEYLVDGLIVNASGYLSGEVTDMAEVGVKAVDEYTLEYTLEAPCTYFLTMLGWSNFAPLCRSYYVSQGGKFGDEFDSSAADYTYGLTPDNIAYCGPYLVTNATEKNTIVFKANSSYWNADNINIKTLTWLFNDGADATKGYNDAVAGTIDGVNLNTSSIESAKNDGLFDTYAYTSNTDACTYTYFYNVNRSAFANFNDSTAVVSPQTEEDAARTNAAMMNVHFRRAISFAVDRSAYNAQAVGEDLKYVSLRNSYTPANFVYLEEDVTIDINGTATTFKAGTYYGEVLQAQLDADEFPIKVWDAEANDGVGSGDGFDGWYNVDNAVAELEIAIEELAAEGVTIDEANPIQIDIPYPSNSEVYTNRVNAYAKSIQNALGGKVVVNLVAGADYNDWYYAGYYAGYGYESNFDVYDLTGWIPDYGDPCSYLDTCLGDYDGYMAKCFGIY
ncbi:MAG: peptide ABC transporter substrate-binding protein [Lachnospiraceae bacterium]